MIKAISTIIILLLSLEFANGQSKVSMEADSIFFLNVTKTHYLKVLKTYNNNPKIPYKFIDFPHASYDSVSKSIRLLRADFPDSTLSDSIKAVIRIVDVADKSWGSGSADNLGHLKYPDQSYDIDSIIKISGFSQSGSFNLVIENKKVEMNKNMRYSFKTHHQIKTKDSVFDDITDYLLENRGLISRHLGKD